jgi:transposase
MLVLETVAKIRRAYFVHKKAIKAICRELKVSRKVVRKVLRSDATEFHYERGEQPLPRIGPWQDALDQMLASNEAKPSRERLTLIRIFEALRGVGYEGGYDAVRRYARVWQRDRVATSAEAFIPLSFAPGEAYQFDWSHEVVLINGTTVTVKVAHVRLCHSRMLFVRAYPRETQEMVFDAHDRAFSFFKGACVRGVYDNMKTAVETIFVGRERAYNRRFLQMCSHYLVDPVACNPASGWEKGQVENQVGLVRERFFAPRLRVKNYDELNAWLLDQCVAYAKAHRHPERRELTIWQMFEAERPSLVPYADVSTGSTGCPRRSPRPVWFSSTRTNTRCRHEPSGDQWKSAPMLIGSSCARMAGLSAITVAASGATRRCSIRGTTSRFWRVNRVRCGMVRRSRTGFCPPGWSGSAASLPALPTATAKWSRSSLRC